MSILLIQTVLQKPTSHFIDTDMEKEYNNSPNMYSGASVSLHTLITL